MSDEEYEDFRHRESVYEAEIERRLDEQEERVLTETEEIFGSEAAFWKWKEGRRYGTT
jgi:hypothetical protein